jgi:hypothetical protein
MMSIICECKGTLGGRGYNMVFRVGPIWPWALLFCFQDALSHVSRYAFGNFQGHKSLIPIGVANNFHFGAISERGRLDQFDAISK